MEAKYSLVLVVVVVNAVNELKLIKHYIRKYSAMTASGWGGLVLILEPLQPYTENDSSMSSSALKHLSGWASLTYTGSLLLNIKTIFFLELYPKIFFFIVQFNRFKICLDIAQFRIVIVQCKQMSIVLFARQSCFCPTF